jgi:hypothetical protein
MLGTHNIALSGNVIYICYEVKTGLLPNKAIVEMICNIDSDCDSNDIVKRIDVLKSAIPEDWTKTIQTEIFQLYYTSFYKIMPYDNLSTM